MYGLNPTPSTTSIDILYLSKSIPIPLAKAVKNNFSEGPSTKKTAFEKNIYDEMASILYPKSLKLN